MKSSKDSKFNTCYERHCKHLKLNGLQPRTIDAYARAIRRIADFFNGRFDALTYDELLDNFHQLKQKASWRTVSLFI